MSVDYRGIRLIEQVLEAEERRDNYYTTVDSYHEHAKEESQRLLELLCDWVANKFNMYDPVDIRGRTNELLKTFRI